MDRRHAVADTRYYYADYLRKLGVFNIGTDEAAIAGC